MGELEKQLQALRYEKEKLEEVDAERERGTAKGRTFEEAVADAVDALALRAGRRRRGGRRPARRPPARWATSSSPIDACNGPARGRIVIEAKDRRLSKPRRSTSWTARWRSASADFAVLVVPTDEELPAKLEPLREYNGDKLVVALDPDAGRAAARATPTASRARGC